MISEKNNPVASLKAKPEARLQFASNRKLSTPPPVKKGRFVTVGIALCVLAAAGYIFWPNSDNAANLTVTSTGITSDSATISWTTAEPLTSQVEYGTTPAYGQLSEFNSSASKSHSVTLSGLKPGTTYDYSALSTNPAGEVTRSPMATFTTGGTSGVPVSSGASATAVSDTSATITWTTDQPLTSQVEFGTTQAYGSLSAFNAAPVTSHSVTLTGLKPGTAYNFAALSTNPGGQITTSPNGLFTTAAIAGAPVVGVPHADEITTTSAKITWSTDQPSASQVEYGPTASYGLLSAFNAAPTKAHALVLTGLTPGTTYNFAALSTSSSGKVGASPNATFTTMTVGGGPSISAVTVGHVTSNSAIISWTTDQPAASQVQYGATQAYGMLSSFNSSQVREHSVTLGGLTPGTTYNYVALSTNAAGMTGKSPNLTFTAGSGPPVISRIATVRVMRDSATITWTTDQPSTSQVQYGTTSLLWTLMHRHRKPYTATSPLDSKLVNSHTVTLTGLTPGSTYNYSVLSVNSGGMQNLSSNVKFVTPR